jgi:hypothetical protein
MSIELNRVLLCVGLLLGTNELLAAPAESASATGGGETQICAPCTTTGEDSPYTHTWVNACCVPNTAGCHTAELTEVAAPNGVYQFGCNIHSSC